MATFSPGDRVAVLLPLPLFGPLDYLAGDGPSLSPGDFVRVPLSERIVTGIVWGPVADPTADLKLKPVKESLPLPPLPEETRRFIDWVAAYCLATPGAVLKMAMSVPKALEPEKPPPPRLVAADPPPEGFAVTPARARALEAARIPQSAADLARAAGVGAGVIKTMAAAGALIAIEGREAESGPHPDPNHPGPILSPEQRAAASSLRAAIGAGFSATLLEGVTGSGKTEVYFEAIAEALAAGRQALVLLPEIALSAQWLKRFEARFGAPPTVWHSDLGEAERRRAWRAVSKGHAKVVVGARSALFLPFPALGLVVVDEEHDGSYKQEEGVCYHARDMAVVRGHIGGLPVVLASATPSLETAANVEAGRYGKLHLPSRHGGAILPEVTLVDLRRDPPPRQHWISPPLREAVERCLAGGEQALLFLNRRGYAPLTLCKTCGFRLQCPHCTAWLVEHKTGARLQCHHCGHYTRRPETCPNCQAEESFAACGPGVERVAEEAAALFPGARIAIMASDLLPGPKAAAELVERMARREIDLLVGTQIVAKGHHFPLLTLVGVIDADLGLAGGDLRAGERTFQLLSQVAGRAGRAEHPGRVLLQTYQTEAKVMQALAAGDALGFARAEAEDRRAGGWPPFGRLAALIVSGIDPQMVEKTAQHLARLAPRDPSLELLGPAPAPLALLRGRHRRRLLLKAPKQTNIQAYVRHWLGQITLPRQVKVQVDIDPYSFL
jgi:primosomal protein N' (replication factor Y)